MLVTVQADHDYLVWFSCGTLVTAGLGMDLSLAVDGVLVGHTRRRTGGPFVARGGEVTLALLPGIKKGQTIGVQWSRSVGAAAITMLERTMLVIEANLPAVNESRIAAQAAALVFAMLRP
jgi:hypothetical protein